MEVQYTTHVQVQKERTPLLQAWNVTEFTRFGMKLNLNFTNVLYVSSASVKDTVKVKFLNPNFFKATRDGLTIEANFTTKSFTAPSLARSEEEFEALESIGSQA